VNEQNAVAIKEFDDSFYRVLIAFFREYTGDNLAETMMNPSREHILDSEFKEIGINSIAFVKMIIALENEFNIEFGDMGLDVENFSSLRQLREYTERMVYESKANNG